MKKESYDNIRPDFKRYCSHFPACPLGAKGFRKEGGFSERIGFKVIMDGISRFGFKRWIKAIMTIHIDLKNVLEPSFGLLYDIAREQMT